MLMIISRFYQSLSALTILGTFIAMINSPDRFFVFIVGFMSSLILLTVAMVVSELSDMKIQSELQIRFVKRLAKKRNG